MGHRFAAAAITTRTAATACRLRAIESVDCIASIRRKRIAARATSRARRAPLRPIASRIARKADLTDVHSFPLPADPCQPDVTNVALLATRRPERLPFLYETIGQTVTVRNA